MEKELFFTKASASGNDFIIIDERKHLHHWQENQVKDICHRRFGIGADQLLLIRNSEKADCSIHIYNNNGLKAQQCGNGLRTVANLLLSEKKSDCIELEVAGFTHLCELIAPNLIKVTFSLPSIKNKYDLHHHQEFKKAFEVDTGNSHLVLWRKKDIEMKNFSALGTLLQKKYHTGINVHAIKYLSPNRVSLDHWERGAGITPSCGSGSIASVFTGFHSGYLDSKVTIENSINNLVVECINNEISLTGAIKIAFSGKIKIS